MQGDVTIASEPKPETEDVLDVTNAEGYREYVAGHLSTRWILLCHTW